MTNILTHVIATPPYPTSWCITNHRCPPVAISLYIFCYSSPSLFFTFFIFRLANPLHFSLFCFCSWLSVTYLLQRFFAMQSIYHYHFLVPVLVHLVFFAVQHPLTPCFVYKLLFFAILFHLVVLFTYKLIF